MTRHITATAELAEIVALVGLLYVFFIAPRRVVSGNAERPVEYIFALIGIGFWWLAATTLVEGI